ncbi:hypothetical protein EON79_21135 [bacterium]|nr:MAG: hypothetical protein EON79_21135 [bacterium]
MDPNAASDETLVSPAPVPDEPGPSWLIYPLGLAIWGFVAVLLLSTVPPELQPQSVGILLFLLPLAMALMAAFLNLFTRPERSPLVRGVARTLVFACLFPFVAWGEWEARRRRR